MNSEAISSTPGRNKDNEVTKGTKSDTNDDLNDASNHSMEDKLTENVPDHIVHNTIPPMLQEALGINENGKCIRHPTCPVLLFTKDCGVAMSGIYKIVPCRVCYADEKSVGIRPGKSFSAVVSQLRNLATAPADLEGDMQASMQASQSLQNNVDVFDLHNSLGSLTGENESKQAKTERATESGNFMTNTQNSTAIMESIMKRLAQVHNWSIRLKDKEIKSLQLHIDSLEQQLALEQAATAEQKMIVKALRKTIQQDLKIIKTMATTQKEREDLDDAAMNVSASTSGLDLSGEIVTGFDRSGQLESELESPQKMEFTDKSPTTATLRYFSPSKAFSPDNEAPPPAETTSPHGTRTKPKVYEKQPEPQVPRRKEHPNSLRSMAKQARRLERMQSTRSIEEPIIEVHDDTEGGDEENREHEGKEMPAMDIQFDPSFPHTPDQNKGDLLDLDDDDDDDDDDDEDDKNKKKFSTGNYWNEGDMKSLKSSKIFQSFRGGLLDIPKSPPKARHDLEDGENGRLNRRKKLQLNTNAMDVLKFPARGVISRTNSSDESILPLALMVDKDSPSKHQSASHPQTPLMGGPLDTPTSASESNNTANHNKTNMGNNDISLDTLAMKLAQLPLSSQTSVSGETPETLQTETKVQQHPNMPAMSPLEYGSSGEGEHLQEKPSIAQSSSVRVTRDNLTIPTFDEIKKRAANAKQKEPRVGKDKKLVFSVTNTLSRDKFGDEGMYTGDVLVTEGLPHGKGKMKYESGRIYDGDWVCGQWHGYGKLLNPNGDTYTGEFFFDSRHGQGVYKWDNGDVYDGSFVSDKRHGKGKFNFHNGNVYSGEFCDGMFEGYGRYDFEGGHYVGEWKAGRYDGSGELVYATGGKYTGEFRNSVAHGFGTEVTADGRIRRGIWTLGKPSEKFDK